MKRNQRPFKWAALMLALAAMHASAQSDLPEIKISKIEITYVGPSTVSDAVVRSNIRLKEGDIYRPASVDDDIRALYGTGFFYNVRVGTEDLGGHAVKLTYVVQGNPTLTSIKFVGNTKFSEKKIIKKAKVASKVGEPLSERKLFTDAQEIQKIYQKAGYQKTTVKAVPSIDQNSGRASVTFEISEAPKIRVTEVVFDGAHAFEQSKLRKTLKTRRWWMWSWLTGSGVLKDEQFEDDKDKLTEFYQAAGYIDFQIKDVRFDYPKANRMVIHFVIDEGRQYKVGKVSYEGNKLFKGEEFAKLSYRDDRTKRHQMAEGSTFTPDALNKTKGAIEDYYGTRGYIDTQIVAVKSANTTTGTIDIKFLIDERDKVFIEKIEIKGNVKTRDRVVRRELAVHPGEIYDMVRVKASKARLEGLQYFEERGVETTSQKTDVPNRRDLVISLQEKSTGNFTVGAGFSSVDSIVGFAEVSQGNFDLFNPPTFTGGGQKARLRASVGTQRQDYQLSFIEPWFLDRRLSLGVDLYHRDLRYLSDIYDETQTGGSVSLTKQLYADSRGGVYVGSVGYTLESIDIKLHDFAASSPQMQAENGRRLVSKMTTSLAYDTRGGGLLPDRGQRTELSGELGGGPFGGDVNFYKLELKTAWYFRGFGEGQVLEVVGRIGVTDQYSDTTLVPIFERYFLGGLYSLRGFKYRDIGPKDVNGEPLGGNSYYFGSLEYSIPIIDRLRFAMFYDIGNVYQKAYDFDFGKWNDNVGVGIRINLPIGPLRLDYGFPINHDSAPGGSGRFNFGVGYTREF
jgi:outer membrane protein insertion porin family